MKKPDSLLAWEQRVETAQRTMPKLCWTCSHHAPRDSADEIYCRKFEAAPPLSFTETEGQCDEWRSIIDEIPF